MLLRIITFFALITALSLTSFTENSKLKMGLLKYNGGGDWYSNPTALPNLARFCNQQLGTNFDIEYAEVEVGSANLFNYAY